MYEIQGYCCRQLNSKNRYSGMSIECSFRHASLSGGYTSESWAQGVASLRPLTKAKNE